MSMMNTTLFTSSLCYISPILQYGEQSHILADQFVQKKPLMFVIGEQVVGPLIDRIKAAINPIFYFAGTLDRYLSFPVAEAANTDPASLSGFLESAFAQILNELEEEYKTSSSEIKEAFNHFRDAVKDKKGWESINANEHILKLESHVDNELRNGLAFSKVYLKVFMLAANHIMNAQHNMNSEEITLLKLLLGSKTSELELKSKLFEAILDKKNNEIIQLKKDLEIVVTRNKELISQNIKLKQLSYFLEGKLAIKEENIEGIVNSIIALHNLDEL